MKIKSIKNLPYDLGAKIELDIESTNWSDEQKKAVKKLFSVESIDKLAPSERELIKDLKFKIGTGTPVELAEAVIARFDVSVVSIK